MKVFFLQLFLASILSLDCSYDSLYGTNSQGVAAFLYDALSERPLVNFTARMNDTVIRTDSRGYFQQMVRRENDVLALTAFPYQTKLVSPHSSQNGEMLIKLDLLPRMAEYQMLLQSAQRAGFAIYSVQEFWTHKETASAKYLLLRHDVDYDPLTAFAMAIVEAQLGVHSTYYFRWSTAQESFVHAIKNLGHEIGLHYETIATFAKDNKLYGREDITPSVMQICRNRLKIEISQFESKFGDIFSITSHGEEWNIRAKMSNAELLRGQNLADFSVVVCGTFLERERQCVDLFVADSGDRWVPFSFSEALKTPAHKIYLLTHPVWWNDDMKAFFARQLDFY